MNSYWTWHQFSDLANEQVYEMLAMRQQVFVVEQRCPYQDFDSLDQDAWHLLGRSEPDKIAAYARLLAPDTRYPEPSIGRVLVCQLARGRGLGRQLIGHCLEKSAELYPANPVRISAQVYLERFYREFGFEPVGEPYDDDGMPHRTMVRSVGG
ncbi:MAG: GNAT family N-acetyltransferase [Cyanobacteria bacterium P01_F01_bin.53]